MLAEAASRMGIPCEMTNVTHTVWGGASLCASDDVVLARCVSHSQNEAVAHILETQGIYVANPSSVMALCGDKLLTTLALERDGVAQPGYRIALSPEGALEAAEEMGYPVVLKPLSGSWGRLLAKVNDRESAEAIIEHKSMLGVAHNTFYLQEYVEKGGFDLRAFVVGGEPICAIRRESAHWITNTARGGKAANFPLDGDTNEILRQVYRAIGGDFLAVDLFCSEGRWLVNEVNDGGEFRNSCEPTGTDIPGAVVRHLWEKRRGNKREVTAGL